MPNLPHIYPEGATFFITFRLSDSLPQDVVKAIKGELEIEVRKIKSSSKSPIDKAANIKLLKQDLFGKFEVQLDADSYGNCWMEDKQVANIIFQKIKEYDGLYYNLIACCIMPNHVHMMVDTSINSDSSNAGNKIPVSKWMQLIKGGSAYEINQYLNRKGQLWARESYDHYVRYNKDGEYERIVHYIKNNPIKAGLGRKYLVEPYMYSIH